MLKMLQTSTTAPAPLTKACAQCPWRLSNQGKRHTGGFYTKANLTRLWNQIRNGGKPQSCHLTDPSHPDHIAAGAKETAVARECPGSVLVVMREIAKMADETNTVTTELTQQYMKNRHGGLTKNGLRYWLVERMRFGGVPFMGGPPIPNIPEDASIGLPIQLRKG